MNVIKKILLVIACFSFKAPPTIEAKSSFFKGATLLSGLYLGNKAIQEYRFRNDSYYGFARKKRRLFYTNAALYTCVSFFSSKYEPLDGPLLDKKLKELTTLLDRARDAGSIPGNSKQAANLWDQAIQTQNEIHNSERYLGWFDLFKEIAKEIVRNGRP